MARASRIGEIGSEVLEVLLDHPIASVGLGAGKMMDGIDSRTDRRVGYDVEGYLGLATQLPLMEVVTTEIQIRVILTPCLILEVFVPLHQSTSLAQADVVVDLPGLKGSVVWCGLGDLGFALSDFGRGVVGSLGLGVEAVLLLAQMQLTKAVVSQSADDVVNLRRRGVRRLGRLGGSSGFGAIEWLLLVLDEGEEGAER